MLPAIVMLAGVLPSGLTAYAEEDPYTVTFETDGGVSSRTGRRCGDRQKAPLYAEALSNN